MKKMIFAAVVAAFVLVACDTEENRSCWKATYTIPATEAVKDSTGEVVKEAKDAITMEVHKWATQAEMDACLENWNAMGYQAAHYEAYDVDEDGNQVKTMADCLSY